MSVLLIILAVADWAWTAVIVSWARRLPEPALQERAAVSVILSLIATVAAVLGGVRLGLFSLPNGVGLGLLAAGLLLVSAPQFIWGMGLLMGKFR